MHCSERVQASPGPAVCKQWPSTQRPPGAQGSLPEQAAPIAAPSPQARAAPFIRQTWAPAQVSPPSA
jgi:hypothetical protein